MVKIRLRYPLAGVALVFVAAALTHAAQAETRWRAERGARPKPRLTHPKN